MTIKKIVMATAAAGLALSPIAVSAATADRSAAPAQGESDLLGAGTLVTVLAVAAVVAGIIIVADDNNDPASA